MPLNLIILIIFFLALILIALLYRNSTLDKLPMLDGESLLFEESNIRVEQAGSPRSVVFRNCIVRVTGSRIIIAQKMMMSKRYALRHVIEYHALSDKTDLKATLTKGYLNFAVKPGDVQVSGSGAESSVTITIPRTVLTGNQFVTYKTNMKERYRDLLL